ncbi:jg2, partial [Pararge aegeria aegeria]
AKAILVKFEHLAVLRLFYWPTALPCTNNICGDHTEVIELDYDPKTATYEELLDMFWANHEYGLTTKLKRQP